MDTYISDGHGIYVVTRYGERDIVARAESHSLAERIADLLNEYESAK